MATKTATSSAVEPIDRLEEKIKLLVSVIGRLRAVAGPGEFLAGERRSK